MGEIVDAFNVTYRDYSVDGDPSSGPHVPTNAEIRPLGTIIEDEIDDVIAQIGNRVDGTLKNYFLAFAGNTTATGSNNTAVGHLSAQRLTTGSDNATFGYLSGNALTTAGRNSSFGSLALAAATTATDATAVGYRALYNLTTGTYATAVGSYALAGATGSGNTALGYNAGKLITTGGYNTFVGFGAGGSSGQKVDAVASIAIGYNAATTKSAQAMLGSIDITETVLRGEIVLGAASNVRLARLWPGNHNYFMAGAGPTAEPAEGAAQLGPAAGNLGVGRLALAAVTQGITNTAVGFEALTACTIGVDHTSVGAGALRLQQSGSGSTAIGKLALAQATSGSGNTALGCGAGTLVTTGGSNTFVGYGAGGDTGQKVDAVGSIAIGYNTVTTKSSQAVLGGADISETVLRGEIVLGASSNVRLARLWPDHHNYFLAGAGPTVEPAEGEQEFGPAVGNFGAGYKALEAVTEGITNVAVGFEALMSCTIGVDHTAVGAGALRLQVSGVGCTAVGKLALANATTGTNNTALGDTALEFTNGNSNTATGYSAGIKSTGDLNSLYGLYAGGHADGRNGPDCPYDRCNVFGAAAMQLNLEGDKNNLFGTYAGHVLTAGENCGFGDETLRLSTTGARNACFGNESGWQLTEGTDNVFVGYQAGRDASQKADVVGSIVIGAGAYSTRDNEIVIGKTTDTHVTIAGVTFTKAQLEALLALVA